MTGKGRILYRIRCGRVPFKRNSKKGELLEPGKRQGSNAFVYRVLTYFSSGRMRDRLLIQS